MRSIESKRLWLALTCFALAGCALLGKNEPAPRRYFTPESPETAAATKAPAAAADGPRVRLGHVSAWSHLRERMVVRTSARELSYLENRRWTERPDVYLYRALSRALEDRGLAQDGSAAPATLDVELTAFEEAMSPHRAVFQAIAVIRDAHGGARQQTVTIEEPVADAKGADPAAAAVEALTRTLQAGVSRICELVTQTKTN
jgi:ABC-type uncharacterized transport system auxiliary subunit